MRPRIQLASESYSSGLMAPGLDGWWYSAIDVSNQLRRPARVSAVLLYRHGADVMPPIQAVLFNSDRVAENSLELAAGAYGHIVVMAWRSLSRIGIVSKWPPEEKDPPFGLGCWECTVELFADGKRQSKAKLQATFERDGLGRFTPPPRSLWYRVFFE